MRTARLPKVPLKTPAGQQRGQSLVARRVAAGQRMWQPDSDLRPAPIPAPIPDGQAGRRRDRGRCREGRRTPATGRRGGGHSGHWASGHSGGPSGSWTAGALLSRLAVSRPTSAEDRWLANGAALHGAASPSQRGWRPFPDVPAPHFPAADAPLIGPHAPTIVAQPAQPSHRKQVAHVGKHNKLPDGVGGRLHAGRRQLQPLRRPSGDPPSDPLQLCIRGISHGTRGRCAPPSHRACRFCRHWTGTFLSLGLSSVFVFCLSHPHHGITTVSPRLPRPLPHSSLNCARCDRCDRCLPHSSSRPIDRCYPHSCRIDVPRVSSRAFFLSFFLFFFSSFSLLPSSSPLAP